MGARVGDDGPARRSSRATSAAAGRRCSCPTDPSSARRCCDLLLLDKALYELNYELNNRPEWVRIPLRGHLRSAAMTRRSIQRSARVGRSADVRSGLPERRRPVPGARAGWRRASVRYSHLRRRRQSAAVTISTWPGTKLRRDLEQSTCGRARRATVPLSPGRRRAATRSGDPVSARRRARLVRSRRSRRVSLDRRGWTRPQPATLVIYELHVGTFTPKARSTASAARSPTCEISASPRSS